MERLADERPELLVSVEKLIVATYLSGGTIRFADPEAADLMARGFCYLEMLHDTFTYSITEPLMIDAARSYLEANHKWSILGSLIRMMPDDFMSASGRGNLFERVVAAALLRFVGGKYGGDFAKVISKVYSGSVPRAMKPFLVLRARTAASLDESGLASLLNRPDAKQRDRIFFPPHLAGPDLVALLGPPGVSNDLCLLTCDCKFYSATVPTAQAEHNRSATSKIADGADIPARALQLEVLFPTVAPEHLGYRRESDSFLRICIDSTNCSWLFTSTEVALLVSISKLKQ
jgi:hypothetical protein